MSALVLPLANEIKYLQSTYCVSSTILGAGGIAETKTDKGIIAGK